MRRARCPDTMPASPMRHACEGSPGARRVEARRRQACRPCPARRSADSALAAALVRGAAALHALVQRAPGHAAGLFAGARGQLQRAGGGGGAQPAARGLARREPRGVDAARAQRGLGRADAAKPEARRGRRPPLLPPPPSWPGGAWVSHGCLRPFCGRPGASCPGTCMPEFRCGSGRAHARAWCTEAACPWPTVCQPGADSGLVRVDLNGCALPCLTSPSQAGVRLLLRAWARSPRAARASMKARRAFGAGGPAACRARSRCA